jgi:hypothetical protein
MLKYKPRWALGVYAIICNPISFLPLYHARQTSFSTYYKKTFDEGLIL